MNSLYNITNNFVALVDKAQEGIITEEEYNQLGQELAMELQNKSANIAGYIQERVSLVEAIDVQIKRLQELKKSEQNKLDNFKKYVKDNMERLGITKIETELGTLSISKSPTSVEVVNEKEIPDDFMEHIITVKPNKKAIIDNYKATGEIPAGVIIHDDNNYLRVK